jgi:hypothetical protein
MDEKRKEVYTVGGFCTLFFFIFLGYMIFNASIMSSESLWVLGVIAAFFGVLGFGSLLKPDSVGVVASELMKRMTKNTEEGSDSSNNQNQENTSGGVQVISHDQSKVNINYNSGKKENSQGLPEKEILRNELEKAYGPLYALLNHPLSSTDQILRLNDKQKSSLDLIFATYPYMFPPEVYEYWKNHIQQIGLVLNSKEISLGVQNPLYHIPIEFRNMINAEYDKQVKRYRQLSEAKD